MTNSPSGVTCWLLFVLHQSTLWAPFAWVQEHFHTECTMSQRDWKLTEVNKLTCMPHWPSELANSFAVLRLHWQRSFLPVRIGGVVSKFPSTVHFMFGYVNTLAWGSQLCRRSGFLVWGYGCMYVYVCICMYVYVCVCMYVCMYVVCA